MARGITSGRFLLFAAGLLCCVASVSVYAAGDGGYAGLIAPAAPERADAPPAAPNEPPGYAGVVPGHVAEPVPEKMTPAAPALQMSTPQGFIYSGDKVYSTSQLEALAATYGRDQSGLSRLEKLQQGLGKFTANGPEIKPGPRPLLKGKPPMEYVVETQINMAMTQVADASLSAEVRTAKANQAYKDLSVFLDGIRNKRSVPDKTYLSAGFSQEYVDSEKTVNDKCMTMLNAALKEIDKYR